MGKWEIVHADCLEYLRSMDETSIDALVTDPPAGISFMGKAWDDDKGGRDEWVKWLSEVMRECRRVLKPGAHALVWAIPRTSHWTATAIEDAGFEIRDVITHLFGSGFPKSLNVSKAIDKAAGAEREVLGPSRRHGGGDSKIIIGDYNPPTTAPSTSAAKQWDGFGTALKPAAEFWILARNPLSEKTVAANVCKHGTGAINVDGCRVGLDGYGIGGGFKIGSGKGFAENASSISTNAKVMPPNPQGRFPANLVLSHNPDCEEVGVKKIKAIKGGNSTNVKNDVYGDYSAPLDHKPCGFGGSDGTETVPDFRCTEGCAVKALDGQSGVSISTAHSRGNGIGEGFSGSANEHVGTRGVTDRGGASRFFYCAKVSPSERNAGLEIKNGHPTVKALKLMRYLIRLITPPGGKVLDPFAGSGSTGVAAVQEGFEFIGVEREAEYVEIAKARIEHSIADKGLFK